MIIYINPLISKERLSEIFNELRNLFDDITYYISDMKFCCYQRKVGIIKILEHIQRMKGIKGFLIDDIMEEMEEFKEEYKDKEELKRIKENLYAIIAKVLGVSISMVAIWDTMGILKEEIFKDPKR